MIPPPGAPFGGGGAILMWGCGGEAAPTVVSPYPLNRAKSQELWVSCHQAERTGVDLGRGPGLILERTPRKRTGHSEGGPVGILLFLSLHKGCKSGDLIDCWLFADLETEKVAITPKVPECGHATPAERMARLAPGD